MLIEKLLKVALLGSSWVMYLLLALSVFSISTMIERWIFFRKRHDDIDALSENVLEGLEAGRREDVAKLLAESRSIEARVISAAMRYLDAGAEAVCDAIDGAMLRERKDVERGCTLLGTLGNNAPFIGLFGTVIGVIIAFQQLGASQSPASMSNVMSGIAEALVATGVGLFVAIPAVVAYNIIQKRLTDIEDNVAVIAKDLSALLKAGLAPATARGARAVPAAARDEQLGTPVLRDFAASEGGGA